MKDWFSWNGVRCTEYGIHVTAQPSIIRPSERVTFTNIPGRPGSLTTLEADDVYDDFILPVECTVADLSCLSEICAWLRGAGKLQLPARPGGFYHARVANQIQPSQILRNHENRAFTVNFRCQPFWYQENVPEITVTTSGTFVTNPGSVYSEPVITVYGSGEITLMVGMTIVELDGNGLAAQIRIFVHLHAGIKAIQVAMQNHLTGHCESLPRIWVSFFRRAESTPSMIAQAHCPCKHPN